MIHYPKRMISSCDLPELHLEFRRLLINSTVLLISRSLFRSRESSLLLMSAKFMSSSELLI